MSDTVNIIDLKIDNIDSRVSSIDQTMALNTQSLIAHMKRTELLEQSLHPIRNVYEWAIISGKVIGVLALIVTIVGGFFEAVKFILKGGF